jgi:hypothetical protein
MSLIYPPVCIPKVTFWTECGLHTLIPTLAILNQPPHFVPDLLWVKCELRDVIFSFVVLEVNLDF